MSAQRLHRITARLLAFVLGAGLALVLSTWGLRAAAMVYHKIGITIIALLPLAIWTVWTVLRHGGGQDLTLDYIGTTAQRVGLLGTVVGIVAATLQIGEKLDTGAAGAVSGALPAVGQALISTAVGFVIALVCDLFRYLNQQAGQSPAPAQPSTPQADNHDPTQHTHISRARYRGNA